jgi:sugar phosphate isomerase/epimerase
MNIDQYGMDTITLAGPLEGKLRAVKEAGFTQIMLQARDIAGHPGGEQAAIDAVRASGLRVTGFQVLRDFEGLTGHLHDYKIDIARAMLSMCHALGSKVLLCCSSTSTHAENDRDAFVRDLSKLAMLAVPFNIGSRSRRCRGGATSTRCRRRGTSCAARIARTSGSP